MPKARLTATSVDRLKAPAKGRIEYWDNLLPGFGLRISETGAKTWVLMYRVGKRQRRLTLGKYPALGLAKARERARAALDQVDHGDDPAAKRAALQGGGSDTFDGAAALFMDRYARRHQRNPERTEYLIKRYVLPEWKGRKLASIRRGDVALLVDGIAEGGAPVMANRVLTVIKKLFVWVVARDLLETNPTAGVQAPGREVARDRVLTDAEVKAVWQACEVIGYPFGPLFRLLLLTGQRRDEVARIAWPDIADDTWTLPREITKSDRLHLVPLSALAVETIEAVPRLEGCDLLFPSRNGSDRPVSGFSRAKRQLDAESGVGDWRLHDLRRTVASGLARMRTPPHVVEAVLNHRSGTISGVAAVYNRYSYLDEKCASLNAWAGHVQGLAADNVLRLERA